MSRLRSLFVGRLVLGAAIAWLVAASSAAVKAADKPARPNIVVFLADDLGWGDLACYGHPRIKTPHLDQFAAQGLRFKQCYSACAVCSPSRSSILTGRTPYRNGVWRWIPTGHRVHLRTSEITIPKLLKKIDYDTCHVGKWHLNGHFNSDKQPQPGDHGYDHWFATQNNAAPTHKNPTNFVRNGKPVGPLKGFSAPLVVEEAVRWLRDRPNSSRPFFLTVWTHEPHLPIESDPAFMDLYKDISDPGIRQHHGNVTQLDHAFGNLMKALDEMQLADRTLVIFTSDNGPEGAGKGNARQPNSQSNRTRGSTGGLRGRKRHSHEGGIRVPGIIRWPDHVHPGTTSDTPIIGSDIFSTICAVVDVPLPKDRTIDGASILPVFQGKPISRPQPLYWRNHLAPQDSRVALRVGDWKVISDDKLTSFELYNIKQDWQETTNVAARFPEKFAEMRQALIRHDKAVLKEGPDWWKNEPPRRKRKRKKKKVAP